MKKLLVCLSLVVLMASCYTQKEIQVAETTAKCERCDSVDRWGQPKIYICRWKTGNKLELVSFGFFPWTVGTTMPVFMPR